MLITHRGLYNNSRKWREYRARAIEEQHQCQICGSMKHLVVHHINPIQWKWNEELQENAVEVDSIYDLLEVPLQVLCQSCHNAQDDKNNGEDNVRKLMGW